MKYFYFLLCAITISCTHSKYPDTSEIFGLASPISLEKDTTRVVMEDYFMDVSVIKKVTADSAYTVLLSADKKTVQIIPSTTQQPTLSLLHVETAKGNYDILMQKNRAVDYTFSYVNPKAKKVSVCGDLNNWNRNSDSFVLNNGAYMLTKALEPGVYQYLLHVDGKDITDPFNTDSTSNGNGGYNSVLKIGLRNAKMPVLNTASFSSDEIKLADEGDACEKVFVLWENYQLTAARHDSNTYTFKIPAEARKLKRSFIRAFGYNAQGTANDLLIPLENGNVVSNAAQITREDKEGDVYYFMMVDRFLDGNKNNTQKVITDSLADRANYYGGDLAGITQKINENYFSNLGINTIWVSPLNQNPEGAYHEYIPPRRKYSGYHGYWVVSISNVDHRLGTEAELKEMVKAAHDHGMNVILDFVSNHVHMENPIYQQHKDTWFNSIYLPNGEKNLRRWNEYDLTTWFDEFLADINYDNPEPLKMFTDSAVGWIKRFDLDGFRHDAVKHVPQIFWRTLTYKLKKEVEIPQNKHLIQIGETFGSRRLMNSYIGSGQLDAQFDFNVYFDARSAFIEDAVSFDKAKNAVNASLDYFGHHHLMGNITGNHDITRFMAYAGKGMKFSDNDRETGWEREVKVEDTIGYSKLQMMTAFIASIPGVPVIYYGDEVGMVGANDPDNRRPMIFDGLDKFQLQTKDIATKLVHLRRSSMPLMYGTYQDLMSMDQAAECSTYAFLRTYFNQAVLVVFNKTDQTKTLSYELPARFAHAKAQHHFNGDVGLNGGGVKETPPENSIQVSVPAYGFEVITLEY